MMDKPAVTYYCNKCGYFGPTSAHVGCNYFACTGLTQQWADQLEAENARLREDLAAAQATIAQMREALERCTKFTQEDYDALALQPCPEVLNKVRAEAAMATIEWVWSKGSVIPREAYSYVKRIEQGEAG